MKDIQNESRRKFIGGLAMAAAGITIVPRHVLGGKGFIAPSDKVNIGMIGVGGKGRQNASNLFNVKNAQITAIADPAEYWDLKDFYYKSKAGRGPVKQMIEEHYKAITDHYKVTEYIDFREMLEKDKGIDAVVCSTPDNTHAYISIQAMKAGKHVYCEKPLTHNVWEARRVADVASTSGLSNQMGNGLHSGDGIRQTVEIIQSGILGKVEEAHTWVPATRWLPGLKGLPTGSTSDGKSIGWDMWLGPTPFMAYHEDYTPVAWRDFWALGCGALGDFGCHDLDPSVWAFNLHAPKSIEVHPAGYSDKDIAPYGEIGYYEFEKDGNQKALKQYWYSGGLMPQRPEILPDSAKLPARGTMFKGSKGILVTQSGGSSPKVYFNNGKSEFKAPKPTIRRSTGHYQEWVDAIKGGPEPGSNFEYGARLTEITLLGVVSLRLGGKKINWDSKNMKAIGMPEADPYLREPVRAGWEMV